MMATVHENKTNAVDEVKLQEVALRIREMREICAFSVEEMARLDGLMISAGFDPQTYNHVLPGEKDLSLEEALLLAAQALENNYGVKREAIDESSFAYTDLTQEATHRQWYFWIQNHELQMGWQITLDAQTGEILDLLQESFAGGNG